MSILLGCATPSGSLSRLATVEAQLGRTYALFSGYDTTGAFPTATLDDCVSKGRTYFHKRRNGNVTFANSANGALDSFWDADATVVKNRAAAIRAAGVQVWVGTEHEVAAGHTAADGPAYRDHYSRMVSRWRTIMGADIDLVRFVVSSTSYTIAQGKMDPFVPPLADFDLFGWTGYNNYPKNKWRTPYDTLRGKHNGLTPIAYDVAATLAPGKPIVVVECSCEEQQAGGDIGASITGKRDWYNDLQAVIQTLPNIAAFIQWDNSAGVGGAQDPTNVHWPVDSRLQTNLTSVTYDFSGPTFQQGYKPFALSSYMGGTVATQGQGPPPAPTIGPLGVQRARASAARVSTGSGGAAIYIDVAEEES